LPKNLVIARADQFQNSPHLITQPPHAKTNNKNQRRDTYSTPTFLQKNVTKIKQGCCLSKCATAPKKAKKPLCTFCEKMQLLLPFTAKSRVFSAKNNIVFAEKFVILNSNF
jgi:hypothetical protein